MTYVLSDIHGNRGALESILAQIDLNDEDCLYILGDISDRIFGGLEMLKQLMKMPNVSILMGNHEYMMIKAIERPTENNNCRRWFRNGGEVTLSEYENLPEDERQKLLAFIKDLPVSFRIEVNGTKYILVHGAPKEFLNMYPDYRYGDELEYSVWMRMRPYMKIDGYTIIFGHTGTWHYQENEPPEVWFGKNLIAIDCGAGYQDYGRLACLRLDDMKCFYSEVENKQEE